MSSYSGRKDRYTKNYSKMDDLTEHPVSAMYYIK